MANHSTLSLADAPNPVRIELERADHIDYWKEKFRCTEFSLRAAVRKVGDQVAQVASYFGYTL